MSFLFPPRPKGKMRPQDLDSKEKRNCWIWQPKFDGDRCPASIANGKVTLYNRFGRVKTKQKYDPIRKDLESLGISNAYFDGELMEANSVLVLFDILKTDFYLRGVNQLDRLSKLHEVCGNPTELRRDIPAYRVSKHLAIAIHGDDRFKEHYDKFVKHKLIEGLLLRKKDSTLFHSGRTEYEIDWQLRCRRPHTNYNH